MNAAIWLPRLLPVARLSMAIVSRLVGEIYLAMHDSMLAVHNDFARC